MASTNVPAVRFTETGVALPRESEVLDGVFTDIDLAFGGGVNKALATPQGQLATSLTAIIADKNEQIALVANQVNPDYADGVWQDAIGRIYFLNREGALPTIVQCRCVGAVGVRIPAGTRAQDTSGNLYICTNGGTIGASGMVELAFHAQQAGPVPCPAGTLTTIFQTVPGWDTINNEHDGVIGRDVESRADFEIRRRASVALNAHGSVQAIYGTVFAVPGVLDCFAMDNPTGDPVIAGPTDYQLRPHSVYVAVFGGDDNAVAQAIWSKKDLGCDMNGNTTVVVPDTTYTPPYPQYNISFERPELVPVKFSVTLTSITGLPFDIADQVRAAIINAFAGLDGRERARIGGIIYASRFYAPVAQIKTSSFAIVSITIGTTTATELSLEMGIDQMPIVQASDIEVALI